MLLEEVNLSPKRWQAEDIARNELALVFLRDFGYYKGVLFLYTNHVRAFDAAFTSRMRVALYHRDLTDADRESI